MGLKIQYSEDAKCNRKVILIHSFIHLAESPLPLIMPQEYLDKKDYLQTKLLKMLMLSRNIQILLTLHIIPDFILFAINVFLISLIKRAYMLILLN